MIITEEKKTQIYQDYHQKVEGFLMGKICHKETAEDLCSTVFLKVYQKLPEFDETKASLSTWIFTICRNTLTDYYRTRRVTEELPDEVSTESGADGFTGLMAGDTTAETVLNNETLERLAKGLEALPERERDILVLHFYQGRKLKDIAETMNISYSYVKILQKTALLDLRKAMEA